MMAVVLSCQAAGPGSSVGPEAPDSTPRAATAMTLPPAWTVTAPPPSPTPSETQAAPGEVSATPSEVPLRRRIPIVAQQLEFMGASQAWLAGPADPSPEETVALARSDDGGRTWRALPFPASVYIGVLDSARFMKASATTFIEGFYFASGGRAWAYGDRLYSTQDGGRTWNEQEVKGVLTSFTQAEDGTIWAIDRAICDSPSVKDCRFDVIISEDNGSTWKRYQPPDVIGNASLIAQDRSRAWILSQWTNESSIDEIQVLTTGDGGSTWSVSTFACPRGELNAELEALDNRHLWLACGNISIDADGQKAIFTSSDAGRTWDQVVRITFDTPPRSDDLGLTGHVSALEAISPSHAWLMLAWGCPYRTVDGGDTWERSCPAPPDLGYTGVAFADVFTGWAYHDRTVFRTENGGGSWSAVFSGSASIERFFHVDTLNPQVAWLAGYTEEGASFILVTSDGGEAWTCLELPSGRTCGRRE